jgi:Uma2 family endonuclease
MSVAVSNHLGPWSEDDYFALGETADKIELIDGSLIVSPRPSVSHQRIAFKLGLQLHHPATRAGLIVLPEINLQLAGGRVVEPDLVIAEDVPLDRRAIEAHEVKMVIEIVSPSNAGTDRLLKPALYASAGIGWYLRVEQPDGSVELNLHRLDGDHYAPAKTAGAGQNLMGDEPFGFIIAVDSLLP